MSLLSPGKLPMKLLDRLLSSYEVKDKRVILGPKIGEDAAVIDMGDKYLVAKTDPITFTAENIAWYVVNINANDIATMGAIPRWFLATVLLPEKKANTKMAEKLFKELVSACEALNISLCGGHTEITCGLDRPIIIGNMLGEVEKDKLVDVGNIEVGDSIVLTKGIAIEAASIIAREKGKELANIFGRKFVNRIKKFIYAPGISVVKDAMIASSVANVHAMHDPTEGGLYTGLLELSKAGNVGLVIYKDRISLISESKILCEHYNLDIMGAIASGALLIAVDKRDTEKLIAALQKDNISSAVIGKVMKKSEGVKIKEERCLKNLPEFHVDEITKIYRRL